MTDRELVEMAADIGDKEPWLPGDELKTRGERILRKYLRAVYEAGARDLAVAEARAAYWRADSDLGRLIWHELKTNKSAPVCGAAARRGEALANLEALGAKP